MEKKKNNDFCPTPPLLELDNCWQTSNELVILSEEFKSSNGRIFPNPPINTSLLS